MEKRRIPSQTAFAPQIHQMYDTRQSEDISNATQGSNESKNQQKFPIFWWIRAEEKKNCSSIIWRALGAWVLLNQRLWILMCLILFLFALEPPPITLFSGVHPSPFAVLSSRLFFISLRLIILNLQKSTAYATAQSIRSDSELS